MRSRYRSRRRRPSRLRRLWRWLWRSALALVVLAVVVVGTLRFVDPPVTAFMAEARLAAWWEGRSLSTTQRWVDGACVADALKLAVMAAEDQKFAVHGGFDVAQIADALEEARDGGRLRGASTISQQTVKNLFLWPGQSWLRKGLEAALTLMVEALWPKQRILEVYLNLAELGPGVYGAEAASRRFFDKPAAALTAPEAALLAAVLPNPAVMHADAPSAYVRQRQRWILRQMRQVAGLPGVAELLRASAGACAAGS